MAKATAPTKNLKNEDKDQASTAPAAIVLNRTRAPHSEPFTSNPKEPSSSTVILTLYPGVNNLVGEQAEIWAKVRTTSSDIKRMLEGRQLVVAVDADGKDLQSHPATLAKLDSSMAAELVTSTVSLEVLQAWSMSEKRRDVKDALNDQIKVIKDYERRADEARSKG